ncbi:MAG: ATP-binding protein [Bdellovibrionota bacterium]
MGKRHSPLKIVCLTGGPGAGKTAVADVLKREFQNKVFVLPETASLLYNGGFPRAENAAELKRVQAAIYHVQHHAEEFAKVRKNRAQILVCDRGTLDCAAYYPGGLKRFLGDVDTSLRTELARYDIVLHLETPGANMGYDFSNPVRNETSKEALLLDRRIQGVWAGHAHRHVIKAQESFLTKVTEVVELIRNEMRSI